MAAAKGRRVRLARALSKMGLCSRSRAADLVCAGKVKVNGITRRAPEYPVRPEKDHIEVEDQKIRSEEKIYLVLNKARGAVTTASDEKGRETIYHNLPPNLPWVGPVGRLDKASEGLLLLTNDSEWAARILAPETHLSKVYHVQVKRLFSEAELNTLRTGIRTEDGVLRAREISIVRNGERNSWLEITLDEGRNRHIRRMLAVMDTEVLRLIRIAIGPLQLGRLGKNACRPLTQSEKQALDDAMHTAKLFSG